MIKEIGISSADDLKTVEMKKTRKYELLAKQLEAKNAKYDDTIKESDLSWGG